MELRKTTNVLVMYFSIENVIIVEKNNTYVNLFSLFLF